MVTKRKKVIIGVFIVVFVLVLIPVVRYFSLFYGLTVNKSINIRKASGDDTLNILLMGIGGGSHEGPDLTDTIILAHINTAKKTVDLISIPRDLWVPAAQSKINAAYAFAQEKDNKGLLYSKNLVGNITGQPIDYGVVIDFDGFIKLVDLLGGIDVKVPNTLDDYAYPISGDEEELCGVTEDGIASFSAQIATGSATEFDIFPCRYTHLHVDAGLQHLDGTTALRFVRSRHALGVEGSDFARSRRQQLVITAIRNKALSLGTLLNPVRVFNIINTIRANVNTDIPEDEYDDFIKLASSMRGAKINSYVIDQGDEDTDRYGLLVNPPLEDYGGRWVLAPRTGKGNFGEIKQYITCVISGKMCEVGQNTILVLTPTPTVAPRK